MIDLRECLFVTFTYDHANGLYKATLSNGASFHVDRGHVGGRLENALNLFRQSVIALNSGKYVQSRDKGGKLSYSYTEEQIRKFKADGHPDVELPEIDLSLDDLDF